MQLDIVIDKNGFMDARTFYNQLFSEKKQKTEFSHWIKRRTREYSLIEGKDFSPYLTKSAIGRDRIDYLISIECAKILCVIEKTSFSNEFRRYLINFENQIRNQYLYRIKGKDTRKELTDTIQELGINEKMHGFGFSNFTKLVYQKAGIEYHKEKNFRDTLNADQLKVVDSYEKMITSYLEIGYNYEQIKKQLPEFTQKLLEV